MADNQNTGGLVFLSFIVGAVVGGVLGVLFAPKAGKETREDIGHAAGDVKKEIEKFTQQAMGRVDSFIQDEKAALSKLAAKEKGEAKA
jgi:gas vesicle protein